MGVGLLWRKRGILLFVVFWGGGLEEIEKSRGNPLENLEVKRGSPSRYTSFRRVIVWNWLLETSSLILYPLSVAYSKYFPLHK